MDNYDRPNMVGYDYNYETTARSQLSKNIHVNPLCKKILVNKAKFVTLDLNNHPKRSNVPKNEGKIYYNPRFLPPKSDQIHVNPNYLKPSVIHVNRNFLLNSKSSLIDQTNTNCNTNTKSKYKYVNTTVIPPQKCDLPFKIKTKYSIIQRQPFNLPKGRPKVKSKKPRRSFVTRFKLIRTNRHKDTGEFKKISSTQLIRKSVLQQQIEKRRQLRSKTWINKALKTPKTARKDKKDKKRRINHLTKLLRKNNQHCPFFNRFGRCKGKDKGNCMKLHDPKYVTICRKLLQGECSDKDCLLSHDVRPEKMPTCLHYLSGLCKREDCPFLHIKVNEKAPICNNFLQGFCSDVYNCTKRHEYLCPTFAQTGSCPKGKSCVYPHKSRTIKSKLLQTHQKPLLTKVPTKKEVKVPPKKEDKSPQEPPVDANGDLSIKPFTRYFSMPLSFDPKMTQSSSDEDGEETKDLK